MNATMMLRAVAMAGFVTSLFAAIAAAQSPTRDIAQEIFDTMLKVPGVKDGHRPVHAKGIVCRGNFTPTKEAASLSKAAHLQGPPVGVIVRLSDGASDPAIPDNSTNAGPRGIAVRFELPGGGLTDILGISHNGFVVANGEEFLALQKAIVATDPSKPHPWPIEEFLGARPQALKFVLDNRIPAESFATEAFFANHAFIFVNAEGTKQAVRYQLLPEAGVHHLSEAEAQRRGENYLFDDLKARVAMGPVQFRLVVQLANPGDVTKDSTVVWPEDRKTVELGTISVTSLVPDSTAAEKTLAFDPTNLTPGIELSDDPLPALRSSVYALSVEHRQK